MEREYNRLYKRLGKLTSYEGLIFRLIYKGIREGRYPKEYKDFIKNRKKDKKIKTHNCNCKFCKRAKKLVLYKTRVL